MTSEQLAVTEEDRKVIFEKITQHIQDWKDCLQSTDDLLIKRLSGLSNACFRVQISPLCLQKNKDEGKSGEVETPVLLYRRFE